jgi:hypothetical protein
MALLEEEGDVFLTLFSLVTEVTDTIDATISLLSALSELFKFSPDDVLLDLVWPT